MRTRATKTMTRRMNQRTMLATASATLLHSDGAVLTNLTNLIMIAAGISFTVILGISFTVALGILSIVGLETSSIVEVVRVGRRSDDRWSGGERYDGAGRERLRVKKWEEEKEESPMKWEKEGYSADNREGRQPGKEDNRGWTQAQGELAPPTART